MGAASIPTPPRRGGTARSAGVAAAARLALAETLLASDEDVESGKMLQVVAHGVPSGQLQNLKVAFADPGHPLVFALSRPEPVALARNGNRPNPAALLGSGFLAIPLPLSEKREARLGLLLVRPSRAELDREARWAAEILGQKLAQLRASGALQESEHRLARERELLVNIIDASPDPILLTDTEGRMIISNGRADALFTAKEGDSEGRHRAVGLNNMLVSAALSQQAIDQSGAARRELLLVSPSEGSDLLFELLSSVVRHPRQGTCVVSILRNVTDLRAATEQIKENYRRLKLAEADVRAERDRLDLVIDSVADPILVTDPSGKILLMNAPAERLFTAPEGSGGEVQRAVRLNDAHFSSFVSNVFLSAGASRFRGEISLADPQAGRPLPVEAISGKVLSEHGEVTGVVTILHDRTEALEKARLYEQLERASKELEAKVHAATAELVRRNELLQRQAIELEQASQLKSQFLANMSHEFRTPLNAILGYTSMLLQGVNGELAAPQKKRNLARVDSNARHLMGLINDILDISRIEAGKMPLHSTEFKVSDLISEVMGEAEPLIVRTKLKVETDIPATASKL